MKNIAKIVKVYSDEELLQAEGFDDALLGVVSDFNSELRLAYSKRKCVEVLMQRDCMSYENAIEYFDFNVQGAYVGKKTPIWVDDEIFD